MTIARCVFAVVAVSLSACGVEGDDIEVGSGGNFPDAGPPPWPTEEDELPECTPYPDGFTEPAIEAASGLVFLDMESPWQPVGEAKHVRVEIRQVGTGDLDTEATGEVFFDIGPNAQVVSQTPITGGIVTAVLQFDQPGLHDIGLTMTGSGRTGTAQVWAYDTQLPIWNMEVDDAELADMLDQPRERIKIPMMLTIGDDLYTGEVRVHGGSSRFYRKQSFRLDLDSGQTLPNGANHLILRAEWADKTMLRNYLALEIYRHATWLPTPEAEIVHFRINGRYFGAMWHVDRIDGDYLRNNGLNPNGSLYEADPDNEYAVPGGNLTVPADPSLYREIYQHHKGPVDYTDLIELIEVVLTLDDATFREVIGHVVAVDDYLVYLAVLAVVQDQDHVRKNFYLYRDAAGPDDRWRALPWDLDLSLGHLWTEENDILDERIFSDGSLYVGIKVPEHGYFNALMDRLWNTPAFDARFQEYVDHISAQVYGTDFLEARVDSVICRATPELLADEDKRATNAEYLDRVDEIYEFIDARKAFIDSELGPR